MIEIKTAGETNNKTKYGIDIICNTVPISYLKETNEIFNPELCFDKCTNGCPAWGRYYSCIGKKMDFKKLHFRNKKYDINPVLFATRLSMDRRYDNKLIREFFGQESKWSYKGPRLSRIKYVYGKLDIPGNSLWKVIRDIVLERDGRVYAFGFCKLCKKQTCSIRDGEPCRLPKLGPVFSMERVGIIVPDLVSKFLEFDIDWIFRDKSKKDSAIRPRYLCCVAMAFFDAGFNKEQYIAEYLHEVLKKRLDKIKLIK